jgi:hypothetical protein
MVLNGKLTNMKKGNIQVTYKATETSRQKNFVYSFTGFIRMVKICWREWKKNPERVIVFFD